MIMILILCIYIVFSYNFTTYLIVQSFYCDNNYNVKNRYVYGNLYTRIIKYIYAIVKNDVMYKL